MLFEGEVHAQLLHMWLLLNFCPRYMKETMSRGALHSFAAGRGLGHAFRVGEHSWMHMRMQFDFQSFDTGQTRNHLWLLCRHVTSFSKQAGIWVPVLNSEAECTGPVHPRSVAGVHAMMPMCSSSMHH